MAKEFENTPKNTKSEAQFIAKFGTRDRTGRRRTKIKSFKRRPYKRHLPLPLTPKVPVVPTSNPDPAYIS